MLLRFRHPVTIVTKGSLILRDLDLLAELARQNLVAVMISLTTLDDELKRILEPAPLHPPPACGRSACCASKAFRWAYCVRR